MSGEPGLLSALLPAGVVAADVADDGQAIVLKESEAVFVATAGAKRRRDFTLGRHCAHLALQRLGICVAAIPPARDGAPLWPEGLVGSITHTTGYAASVVARRSHFQGLGLDAEPVGGVMENLFPRLFGAEECAALQALTPEARTRAATLMFCAKEAHYKAQNGSTGLDFRKLRVTLAENRLAVTDGAGRSQGAYSLVRGLAVVLVGVPA